MVREPSRTFCDIRHCLRHVIPTAMRRLGSSLLSLSFYEALSYQVPRSHPLVRPSIIYPTFLVRIGSCSFAFDSPVLRTGALHLSPNVANSRRGIHFELPSAFAQEIFYRIEILFTNAGILLEFRSAEVW